MNLQCRDQLHSFWSCWLSVLCSNVARCQRNPAGHHSLNRIRAVSRLPHKYHKKFVKAPSSCSFRSYQCYIFELRRAPKRSIVTHILLSLKPAQTMPAAPKRRRDEEDTIVSARISGALSPGIRCACWVGDALQVKRYAKSFTG